jgi:hypothetical protein
VARAHAGLQYHAGLARQRLERDGLAHIQKAETQNARAREEFQMRAPKQEPAPAIQRPELREDEALAPQEIGTLLTDAPTLKDNLANTAEGKTPDRADDLPSMLSSSHDLPLVP